VFCLILVRPCITLLTSAQAGIAITHVKRCCSVIPLLPHKHLLYHYMCGPTNNRFFLPHGVPAKSDNRHLDAHPQVLTFAADKSTHT
jgi:hypothetical protein